jgi:hypothetical protein
MPTGPCHDDRPDCPDDAPAGGWRFWRGLAVAVPIAILVWVVLAVLVLAVWRIVH